MPHSSDPEQNAWEKAVNAKQSMILAAGLLLALSGGPSMSEEKSRQHIQIAEIVVDPTQIDSYKSAVTEQIKAAIRL